MTFSRAEQEERELRLHLYAYARLAIGGAPTDEVSRALRELCKITFPCTYPNLISKMAPSRRPQPSLHSGPGIDYGFAVRERAFWIKRHFLSTFGFPDDAFDEGRQFGDRVRSFAEKQADDWLGRRIAIRLHNDDQSFLKTQGVTTRDINPLGLVVAGSLHGFVWIGTVRDRSIVREKDGNARALRIQQLVQPIHVEKELH